MIYITPSMLCCIRLQSHCNPPVFPITPNYYASLKSEVDRPLKSTSRSSNLSVLSINTTDLCSQTTSQLVHGSQSNVEALVSVVNSDDVDGSAVVRQLVAGSVMAVSIEE